MVASAASKQKLVDRLIVELRTLPQQWVLTPVSKKRPLRPDWQIEEAIDRATLEYFIRHGTELPAKRGKTYLQKWDGFGLRTGEVSNGVLAIDADGAGAQELLDRLSGGDLPKTVKWSSGKPGRSQSLYQISDPTRKRLLEFDFGKITLREFGDFKSPDGLEIRYGGCQSVLPPSKHPETGQYEWIDSPIDTEVAPAPQWLDDWLNAWCDEADRTIAEESDTSPEEEQRQREEFYQRCEFNGWDTDDLVSQALRFIPPRSPGSGNYQDCLRVLMALVDHYGEAEAERIAEAWSPSIKGTTWNVAKKIRSFKQYGKKRATIATLFFIAKENGFKFPRPAKREARYSKGFWNSEPSSGEGFSEPSVEPPSADSFVDDELLDSISIPVELDKKDNIVLPKPAMVATVVAAALKDRFAWNADIQSFFMYEVRYRQLRRDGVWERLPSDFVSKLIQLILDNNKPFSLEGLYSADYVRSIISLLQGRLPVTEWDRIGRDRNLIPVANGVFDRSSGALLPHHQNYRFTQQLPYPYDPGAACQPVIDWLFFANKGHGDRVRLCRAFLNAAVCRKGSLQRFLEIWGPGGTGKSTFMTLAIALAGRYNTHRTDPETLQRNQFETANIHGKSLVVIPDCDEYRGKLGIVKQLTGGDDIRFELKTIQAGTGFIYDGMVLIVGNQPLQSSDLTSGVPRRKISLPFTERVAPSHQKVLLELRNDGTIEGEFAQYLPGVLNWVLSMPDEEVRFFLKETETAVPSLNPDSLANLIDTNSIAGWLDNCCVFLPGVRSHIGTVKEIRFTEGENSEGQVSSRSWTDIKFQNDNLYPSYYAWCKTNGKTPIAQNKFSLGLFDLVENTLPMLGVAAEVGSTRDGKGKIVIGVAIRQEEHSELPTPVTRWLPESPPIIDTEVVDEPTTPAKEVDRPDEFNATLTVNQWAGRIESAKSDGQVRSLYESLATFYPESKHPFKQQVWNLLSRQTKKRIELLLKAKPKQEGRG